MNFIFRVMGNSMETECMCALAQLTSTLQYFPQKPDDIPVKNSLWTWTMCTPWLASKNVNYPASCEQISIKTYFTIQEIWWKKSSIKRTYLYLSFLKTKNHTHNKQEALEKKSRCFFRRRYSTWVPGCVHFLGLQAWTFCFKYICFTTCAFGVRLPYSKNTEN